MADDELERAAETPIGRMLLLDHPLLAGLGTLCLVLAKRGVIEHEDVGRVFDVMGTAVRDDLLGPTAGAVRSTIDSMRQTVLGSLGEPAITTPDPE